jgi:hypothetical protein
VQRRAPRKKKIEKAKINKWRQSKTTRVEDGKSRRSEKQGREMGWSWERGRNEGIKTRGKEGTKQRGIHWWKRRPNIDYGKALFVSARNNSRRTA